MITQSEVVNACIICLGILAIIVGWQYGDHKKNHPPGEMPHRIDYAAIRINAHYLHEQVMHSRWGSAQNTVKRIVSAAHSLENSARSGGYGLGRPYHVLCSYCANLQMAVRLRDRNAIKHQLAMALNELRRIDPDGELEE